ncbi:MAG: VIT1/CCC1 transporter family protein [Lewinellaceae bacterium]|nr:VIT1/CCC1 transporter family protein [Saprospiraceae bacterium]MCB9345795.1 VIT1/CCC1 transporter family protein [Lewinellaceae bacterium]
MPDIHLHPHYHDHHPHDHKEEHFQNSEFVTDVVIGMADGLTVPFALAAGLSGAIDASGIVLTAGIAEIVAGSIAMGLGGFLAGQTEVEHYEAELAREYDEVERLPEREKQEIRDILGEYGISPETQTNVVEELAKDKDRWVDFMMKFELGLEKPDERRATKSGLTIGISYIVGGLIPLLPYYFWDKATEGLKYSAMLTLACLLVFGWFKSKATGQKPFQGALKVAAIGTVAAAAAYLVAKMFV